MTSQTNIYHVYLVRLFVEINILENWYFKNKTKFLVENNDDGIYFQCLGVDRVEKRPLQSITNSPVKKRPEELEDTSVGPAKRALSLKKSPGRPSLKSNSEAVSTEEPKEEEDCVIQ